MRQPVLKSLVVAMLAISALAAHAANGPVTSNVITGSGIGNNDFTVNTTNNIQIGLRARERYGNPVGGVFSPTDNTYNGGTNTYNHAAGGFAAIPFTANGLAGGPRASWNFDFSINTAPTLSGGPNLGAYTYLLSLDTDATAAINYTGSSFNPVTSLPDNSYGNNSTGQGLGTEPGGVNTNASLIAGNNLVQNSYNYAFLFPLFNPNTNGTYTIMLQAFSSDGEDLLASSLINVNVGVAAVPEPGSMALVGLALAGLAVVRRRKV